jgi:hypothetical protein
MSATPGAGHNQAVKTHFERAVELLDVQSYLHTYRARKVEANALVVRPEAGRQLCRNTILKYLPADAPERYREALAAHREEAREAIEHRLRAKYRKGRTR